MDYDVVLSYAGIDEEQLVVLSKKTIRTCVMRLVLNKNFMDVKSYNYVIVYFNINNTD